MLDNTRYAESCKLITNHLVKSHRDKDGNSLFCRFGEIEQYIEELHFQLRSVDSAFKIICEAAHEKNGSGNV